MRFLEISLLCLLACQPTSMEGSHPEVPPAVSSNARLHSSLNSTTDAVPASSSARCVDVVFRTTLGPLAGNSRATLLLDVDGDGAMDAYVGSFLEPDVIYLNDGSEKLTTFDSGSLGVAGPTFDAAAADVDGDVVIANWGANSHAIYVNQGGSQAGQIGRFERDSTTELAQVVGSTSGAVLGDLDDDGDLDLDLAFCNRKGGRNAVWINTGLGVFEPKVDALPPDDGGDSTDVAIVDLDRNGTPDLLILNRGGAPYLYLNDGNARFNHCNDVPLGEQILDATACAWGDLQGEGGLDLLIVSVEQPDLQLRLGRDTH
jgi:hypothetical protein